VERLLEELVALERSTLDRWVMKPPFTDPRYDLIDPKVERNGDVARLTFNLVNYGKLPGATERVLARWNATEVYGRMGGTWKLIESHWSFMTPGSPP